MARNGKRSGAEEKERDREDGGKAAETERERGREKKEICNNVPVITRLGLSRKCLYVTSALAVRFLNFGVESASDV